MTLQIAGFSKLSKIEKIDLLINSFFSGGDREKELLKSFWHSDENSQRVFDEFSENTLTNFYFPYGVVPNLVLNGKNYCVPMVIEESSVVAAASKSVKYWAERGGIKAEILGTEKVGQVHFLFNGTHEKLFNFFNKVKPKLIEGVLLLTKNMRERGGGLLDITLVDKRDLEENYFQLFITFDTKDAMGANFINSVLEAIAENFKSLAFLEESFSESEKEILVIMSILSNFTPDCAVRVYVESPIEQLADSALGMSPELFAKKFVKAVRIAEIDPYRAATHNKGIMNGVDAVILATGNDFRAVEACVHAYASNDGRYKSLSKAKIENGNFIFELTLPLALGTVGGLTSLHPLARFSLDMLGRPNSNELMMIVAAIGLAQNFGAVRSLVTSGIQKGHMKMHLMNILNHLEASEIEREKCKAYFSEKVISFNGVREYLNSMRTYQ